mgnify:CR=1 FL=1
MNGAGGSDVVVTEGVAGGFVCLADARTKEHNEGKNAGGINV